MIDAERAAAYPLDPLAEIDALAIRRALGAGTWAPPRPWGDDSWMFTRRDDTGRIIVSVAPYGSPPELWIHASISHRGRLPDYAELKAMHRAVFGQGHAYQCFVPQREHYNHHEFCLHLFGRLDGKPALPDFTGPDGTI